MWKAQIKKNLSEILKQWKINYKSGKFNIINKMDYKRKVCLNTL